MQESRNKTFHQKQLVDGLMNFEVHETTCSHILREKNVFLDGGSYGERLSKVIHDKDHGIKSVLEIGAGLGYLAENFMRHQIGSLKKEDFKYTIAELSPELAKNQKKRLKSFPVKWIMGDILDLSFKNKTHKYDLIIANEMIADLPIEKINRPLGKKRSAFNTRQIKTITDFQKDFKGNVFLPTGVLRMLANLKESCHSDTKILLSEYFTRHGGGSEVALLNHTEYKLNLNLTSELIRNAGFNVEVVSLVDYLELNLNVKVLSKEMTKFFSDHLKVLDSRTAPLSKKELPNNLELSNSAFCRAEWLSIFSNYYFLILSVTPEPKSLKDCLKLKIYKNVNVSSTQKGNITYLLQAHPAKALILNSNEKKWWDQIKSGKLIKTMVHENASAWLFLKKLETHQFVSFK